jgi:hypothetical protein
VSGGSFDSGSFDEGSFDPTSFDFGGGGGGPSFTPASVLVRAFRTIFYGNQLRPVGSTFTITSPFQFTPYGMELVGTPPHDWLSRMAQYSRPVDSGLIRFPGRDETRIPVRSGGRGAPQIAAERGNTQD